MRICFVADAQSVHLQRIVSYFAQKGHEIHLITKRIPHTNLADYGPTVKIHTLAMGVPDSSQTPKLLRLVLWAVCGLVWFFQLRILLKRIKPDVLNCHYITVYGYLGALSSFNPFILTPWGSDVLIEVRRGPLYGIMARYTLRKADIVMCDSQTMKTRLLELGTEPDKIHPLVLGVDTQAFSPDRRTRRMAPEPHGEESPVVISIRNLRPIYNVELLLKAAPLILRRVPNTRFMIAGDGESRDELRRMATELGLSDSVRWIGWIRHIDLPDYLASADVYVSTSLSDSTSLSLQEAMACQVAPVVTDIPANREWIIDGENGFIVPHSDPEALARHVVELLESNDLRKSFGTKCRQIIRLRAEEKDEMSKLESLYLSIAHSGKGDQNARESS